jgi:hypothetical protein
LAAGALRYVAVQLARQSRIAAKAKQVVCTAGNVVSIDESDSETGHYGAANKSIKEFF